MRRQAVRLPDLLHCRDGEPHGLGHRAGGPVRRLMGRRLMGQTHDVRNPNKGHWRLARRACLVLEQAAALPPLPAGLGAL